MDRFEIGRLFHLTHVVGDLDTVDRWYDEIFSVVRFYHGYEELAGRDASLIAIADLVLEPMAPARGRELRNRSVQRFQDRFGEHFHSIAWYVDDVGAIARRLDEHGIRLFNIVGRQVAPDERTAAVWTHPKETFGQLEFARYTDSIADPRFDPDWSTVRWRDHPLGIEGTSHIGIVVRDLAAAVRLYCDVLGARPFHESTVPDRKRSVFVAVGDGTVVELAEPLAATSPEGQELERHGEGIRSVVYRTADLDRAHAFLDEHGLTPDHDDDDTIVLGPAQAFGMTVGFTRQALPDDPRHA
jgi:catechol 2,3-dioxygenase-like lactoylglutathione lyase family enzyme